MTNRYLNFFPLLLGGLLCTGILVNCGPGNSKKREKFRAGQRSIPQAAKTKTGETGGGGTTPTAGGSASPGGNSSSAQTSAQQEDEAANTYIQNTLDALINNQTPIKIEDLPPGDFILTTIYHQLMLKGTAPNYRFLSEINFQCANDTCTSTSKFKVNMKGHSQTTALETQMAFPIKMTAQKAGTANPLSLSIMTHGQISIAPGDLSIKPPEWKFEGVSTSPPATPTTSLLDVILNSQNLVEEKPNEPHYKISDSNSTHMGTTVYVRLNARKDEIRCFVDLVDTKDSSVIRTFVLIYKKSA